MKILLPTDGSRYALDAARALTDWLPTPATVDLLAVIPHARKSGSGGFGVPRDIVGQWRGEANRWLDQTAQLLDAKGFAVRRVTRAGNPARVIAERARAEAYDLVVVGAKGRGDAPFFDIGSVALAALEHAPRSVLMVRGRHTRHRRAPSAARPLRVLVTADGREESARALQDALRLLPGAHSEAHVLAVADGSGPGAFGRRKAWTAAHGASETLRAHGWSAAPSVTAGDAAEQILEAARDADVIVLGSRAVTRIEERHLGSVALEVARAAPCSVLVVREGFSGMAEAAPRATVSAAGTPFEVAYRGVERSDAVERRVLRGLARLEEVAPDLVRCRVTIGRRKSGSRTGDVYHVRVDLTVPGREVAVTRTPPTEKGAETLTEAMDDAFARARERLVEAHRGARHARKAPGRREQERAGPPPRAGSAA